MVHYLWLLNILGATSANAAQLLETYGTPQAIYADRAFLRAKNLITKRQGDNIAVYTLEHAQRDIDAHAAQGVQIVTLESNAYPALLREATNPPILFFVKGDVALLNSGIAIGVVGTRKPSAYGVDATKSICTQLAKAGVTVVSGLADGLDAEAHKAALEVGGKTVAVVAHGLDHCYPAANRRLKELIEKYGAVVSEYPLGVTPEKNYFLSRNRIIAGLSNGLCVAEARKQSGTISTVNHALSLNRDVFAVPGSIFSPLSEGTNALIYEGARMVRTTEDILNEYHIKSETVDIVQDDAKLLTKLSKAAQRIYKTLKPGSVNIAQVCIDCELPMPEALAALTELEMANLAVQAPGRNFSRKH